MRKYTTQFSPPAPYKVAILYNSGYISTISHGTYESACAEMRVLGASFLQCPRAWVNVLNIWMEKDENI